MDTGETMDLGARLDERRDQEGILEAQAADASRISVDRTAFLNRLEEADRQALLASARVERYPSGEVICRQGDPGDRLYTILHGRVAVLKETSGGRPILLGYRGAGELLGEMSLVGRQNRSASLVAVEDSQMLCIEADRFSALMTKNPSISWAVLSVLNDRLQEADAARTIIVQEEQDLARQVVDLTGQTERLSELARVRQETIELLVHDLRTPVAVIDGCLQMLHSSFSPEEMESVDKILSLAERSTGRLMSLLEDLLGAARQERTLAALVYEPINLPRLLQEAVESAMTAIRDAGLALDLELPPRLPLTLGDRAQLRRVIDNLVENAVSYTPDGGRITVAAKQVEDGIEVSVTDTGPGVPEEHREIIFERFTRVPGVQGRRQGFGLGLYFCRQVIEAHGGDIWVEPGPGQAGSRFVFTLPKKQG
jgi:signal transduction histidine kinase